MYIVVSYWETLPGKNQSELIEKSTNIGNELRKQKGVKFLEAFQADDKFIAVHAYESEEVYHQLVDDPKGPFAQAMKKHNIEEVGQFVYSERGEALPHS